MVLSVGWVVGWLRFLKNPIYILCQQKKNFKIIIQKALAI